MCPCAFQGRLTAELRLRGAGLPLPGPAPSPPARRPAEPLLYLEPFELPFDVHFQAGEHGLVLARQVLESAGTTVAATPRPAWCPRPQLQPQSPLGLRVAPVPGGKFVEVRQEVTDTEAHAGGLGRVGGSDALPGGADTERQVAVSLRGPSRGLRGPGGPGRSGCQAAPLF